MATDISKYTRVKKILTENIFGIYIKIIVCYAMHDKANTHTLIEYVCVCVCP